MAAYRRVIQRKFVDGFETLHVPGEDFGEVHPKFAEDVDDLTDTWNLIDGNGNSHFVTFNEDYSHPLITEGWTNLRHFYNFEGKKQIFMTYLGRSRFLMSLGKVMDDSAKFPSFHSLSTKPGRTVYFDITLQQYDMALTSQLVLPPAFHNFLWNGDFDYLILCGKSGTREITEIMYESYRSLTTKLGNGWEYFCAENEFQVGDTIRFKFFEGLMSHMVHVFKLNA